MPASCANAFSPTIALFGCGPNVMMEVEQLARGKKLLASRCASQTADRSRRVFIAITTSSSAALPARSPIPLTVHSICRAPGLQRRQRIRRRQAQIVVAVHTHHRRIAQRFDHPADQLRRIRPAPNIQPYPADSRFARPPRLRRARSLPDNPNPCAWRLPLKIPRRRNIGAPASPPTRLHPAPAARDFFNLYFR